MIFLIKKNPPPPPKKKLLFLPSGIISQLKTTKLIGENIRRKYQHIS